MKVSYLLDILVGGVGYIDQLPVGEVGKKVPIGLPPILVVFGGMGTVWDDGCVLWCVWWWAGPVGMKKK